MSSANSLKKVLLPAEYNQEVDVSDLKFKKKLGLSVGSALTAIMGATWALNFMFGFMSPVNIIAFSSLFTIGAIFFFANAFFDFKSTPEDLEVNLLSNIAYDRQHKAQTIEPWKDWDKALESYK